MGALLQRGIVEPSLQISADNVTRAPLLVYSRRAVRSYLFAVVAGASAAIEVLSYCLTDAVEGVIVPSPYYSGFDADVRNLLRHVRRNFFLQICNRPNTVIIPAQLAAPRYDVSIDVLEKAYQNAGTDQLQEKKKALSSFQSPPRSSRKCYFYATPPILSAISSTVSRLRLCSPGRPAKACM